MKKKEKIICILGPTASGKTSLSISLAKKFNGEIISVDSRQVFSGIEIFSGAAEGCAQKNIPHHLISFRSPKNPFTTSLFEKKAKKIISEISKKGKVPILAGGSSFYFESIFWQNFLPNVKPDEKLRKNLSEKSLGELGEILKKLDENFYQKIDLKNKVRIIRAIEISKKIGSVPEIKKLSNSKYDFFVVNIDLEKNVLEKKIEKGFKKRFKAGFLKEAEILRSKISAKRFFQLGLSYKNIFKLWEEEISEKEFVNLAVKEEQKYSKRQKTYLKKLKKELKENKIKVFNFPENNLQEIKKEIRKFIK